MAVGLWSYGTTHITRGWAEGRAPFLWRPVQTLNLNNQPIWQLLHMI
jgi:hypothetical protein